MTIKSNLKLGVIATAFAVAAAAGAHAQAAPAAAPAKQLNIAVFDTQKVMNGTNAAKRANAELTTKNKAAQSRIDTLEKPLLEKKQKLIAQQGVLAADKFQQASADFTKEVDAFRQQAQKIQAELDQQIIATRKQISDAVGSAVEQIAKEKGYDVILPKGMTIFTSNAVPDISTDALARANKILDK